MRPKTLVPLLLISVLTIPLLATGQNRPRTTAESIRGHFASVNKRLLDMAKDFPEDKYDYKLKPEMRTFAEVLVHVASGNVYAAKAGRGEQVNWDELDPKNYKTKADVVTFVKKSFADGAAAIEARGDKGMSEVVVDPYSHDQTRISDYAYGFIEHSGEHYGQLVVYYRLNNIVPPESRPRK